MTLEYSLEDNDYVTFQLYTASKSTRTQKKRNRTRLIPFLIYFALGMFEFYLKHLIIGVVVFSIGILWYLLYPIWERGYYKRHFEGFIKEKYKGAKHGPVTIQFENDFLIIKDTGSESKVVLAVIEEMSEIDTLLFIKLRGGQSLVIPKYKLENIDTVTGYLRELAKKLGVNYTLETEWKWE